MSECIFNEGRSLLANDNLCIENLKLTNILINSYLKYSLNSVIEKNDKVNLKKRARPQQSTNGIVENGHTDERVPQDGVSPFYRFKIQNFRLLRLFHYLKLICGPLTLNRFSNVFFFVSDLRKAKKSPPYKIEHTFLF